VLFNPQNASVRVEQGTTLLEAANRCSIVMNNLCGGDGICGRCRMIVKQGEISGEPTEKLSRAEIRKGYVLACQTFVQGDLVVEIPVETGAREKIIADIDAERFSGLGREAAAPSLQKAVPVVVKVYLELEAPMLGNAVSDHQLVCSALQQRLGTEAMQMGLKTIRSLPAILRESHYRVTATVGLRKDIAEVMDVEAGNTEARNYMVVVDMGTTTVVAHLVDANTARTIGAKACFNSQGVYGREVTARMIAAEKRGIGELQKSLVGDINQLIGALCGASGVSPRDVTAVVCSGNTAMGHFLLGLPTHNIRRAPYTPVTVEPPPLRAAEVGIAINPRGLLYSLPGVSGWVGSDLTAGILATNMHKKDELALLIDIGTNGEIILGNRDWLISASASAGPALEGASVECGMRAEKGAVEKVLVEGGRIVARTIDDVPPMGLCGSGIIDLVSVLLDEKIIDRAGRFVADGRTTTIGGLRAFVLADVNGRNTGKRVFFNEKDLENVITAKAAIFAAIKILLERLELRFSDIEKVYLAGAFGNYIDVRNAINIGLIPPIPLDKIEFVGNSSIIGAKMAALYQDAFHELLDIRSRTTYYDLMGADDYVEEFRKAMFLPHTDIAYWSAIA